MAKKIKKAVKRIARKNFPPSIISDEEMAYRLVQLYFEEIARMGFKRKLDLDAIINAYFYTLTRLKRKEAEIEAIKKLVLKEENQLKTESKEQLFSATPNTTPTTTITSKKIGTSTKGKIKVKGTAFI